MKFALSPRSYDRPESAALITIFLAVTLLFFSGNGVTAADSASETITQNDTLSVSTSVSVMRIEGTIGPTSLNYLERSLDIARGRNDEILIIEIDTPGGLLDSTQEMVKLLLGSELPTAVYVSPDGATAGSAGAFITLAGHVAAMAPASSIGAASPVTMGGGEVDTVSQKKIFSFAESFIESIAEARGRNVEWAKSAVRDGVAATSTEALELGVIDLIARDLDDLLAQIDGMEIEGRTLDTADAEVNRIEPNLAEIFFSFILRPEVLLILTLVAVYGILGEVSAPGSIVPGVAGVIALILLLFGVAAMPINTAGFLLIGLAIILFVSEAFTPTYGILIAGGGVSFFLGALMLFQDLPEDMQLSLFWLVPATVLTILFFIWISYYGIRAQFTGHRTGTEAMVGKEVEVADEISSEGGRVFFSGEYWNASSTKNEQIPKGSTVRIVRFEGLRVFVEPVQKTVTND